jgi:hypothetical protein
MLLPTKLPLTPLLLLRNDQLLLLPCSHPSHVPLSFPTNQPHGSPPPIVLPHSPKTTIESELGHCLTNAPTSTITTPSFSSLAWSSALGTAFATADMHLLRVSQSEQQRIGAAWAGMGYDAEESQTAKRTLAISFTPASLTVTTANIRSSQDISHLQSITYPQLGFSQKDNFDRGYWEAIKGVMMSAAHRGAGMWRGVDYG